MTNGLPLEDLRRVGAALAKLRKRRGFRSQRKLRAKCEAEGITLAQGTISNIEAGKPFAFLSLVAVLDVLDMQIGDFLVDAGFTSERESYKEFTFTFTVEAQRVKRVSGKVDGPGLNRIMP